MGKNLRIETSSMLLHMMAMLFMLCDHLWGTIVPGNDWLTCVGRIAFPVFAFMIVEGYFHTKNLKKSGIKGSPKISVGFFLSFATPFNQCSFAPVIAKLHSYD